MRPLLTAPANGLAYWVSVFKHIIRLPCVTWCPPVMAAPGFAFAAHLTRTLLLEDKIICSHPGSRLRDFTATTVKHCTAGAFSLTWPDISRQDGTFQSICPVCWDAARNKLWDTSLLTVYRNVRMITRIIRIWVIIIISGLPMIQCSVHLLDILRSYDKMNDINARRKSRKKFLFFHTSISLKSLGI